MSHATVLVLLPNGCTGEDDARSQIEKLMAPYDENGEWFKKGSKWDWWVIGGRWSGCAKHGYGKDVPDGEDILKVKDIHPDFSPFAILTPDGEWHENGTLGWFGATLDEKMTKEGWKDQARRIMDAHKEHTAVLVDYHV